MHYNYLVKLCLFKFSYLLMLLIFFFLLLFLIITITNYRVHCFCVSVSLLQYDAWNDVVPCQIGPTNCQPKWLRTRNAEIPHKEKYFHCRCYHVGRWTANETTWKTVPKVPKSVFWEPNSEIEFLVFEFWGQFSLVLVFSMLWKINWWWW